MSQPERNKILALSLGIVVAITVTWLVLFAYHLWPSFAHRVLNPTLKKECLQIRPGMSRAEAQKTLENRILPDLQAASSPSKLTYTDGDSVCVIEIDIRTDSVTATKLAQSNYHGSE